MLLTIEHTLVTLLLLILICGFHIHLLNKFDLINELGLKVEATLEMTEQEKEERNEPQETRRFQTTR